MLATLVSWAYRWWTSASLGNGSWELHRGLQLKFIKVLGKVSQVGTTWSGCMACRWDQQSGLSGVCALPTCQHWNIKAFIILSVSDGSCSRASAFLVLITPVQVPASSEASWVCYIVTCLTWNDIKIFIIEVQGIPSVMEVIPSSGTSLATVSSCSLPPARSGSRFGFAYFI